MLCGETEEQHEDLHRPANARGFQVGLIHAPILQVKELLGGNQLYRHLHYLEFSEMADVV